MKFEVQKNPDVYRSSNFKEQTFAIGNIASLLLILREKMYSDPPRATVQETMSNGRDAHRELGNPEVPIEVKIPNDLEPNFYIRDFGVGITPDRMANVFIKYGESTKTTSNDQTGGFGLGAKTPFSYTDAFSITSITPEHVFEEKQSDGTTIYHENCLVKREYTAYIDESRIGKLALMSEEVTEEPRGTKISLNIEKRDFHRFSQSVLRTAKYWDVKPKIVGVQDWIWPEITKKMSGDGWFMEENSQSRGLIAIVDGIAYDVNYSANWSDIQGYSELEPDKRKLFEIILGSSSTRIIFNTGELSVAATRDKLEYDKDNKNITNIYNRIIAIVDEIRNKANESIGNSSNLWEAKRKLMEYNRDFFNNSVDFHSEWQGVVVNSRPLYLNKYVAYGNKYNLDRNGKLRSKTISFISVEQRYVFVNDVLRVSPERGRIVTILEALTKTDPNAEVYVVGASDDVEKRKTTFDALEEKENFSKFGFLSLSLFEKKKIARAPSNSGYTVRKVKRFYSCSDMSYVDKDLQNDSGIFIYMNKDESGYKYYYVEDENGNEIKIDIIDLKIVVDLFKITLHVIHKKYEKKIGDEWIQLNEYMQEAVNEFINDSLACEVMSFKKKCQISRVDFLISNYNSFLTHNVLSSEFYYDELFKSLKYKGGIFCKYLVKSKEISEKLKGLEKYTINNESFYYVNSFCKTFGITGFAEAIEKYDNSFDELEKLYKDTHSVYPLFDNGDEDKSIEVINMVDELYLLREENRLLKASTEASVDV